MTLELAFASRELRDHCLNETLATQEFGEPVAARLMARLADMAAVSVVSELQSFPGKMRERSRGVLVLNLTDDSQLVFRSNHLKERTLPDGKIDWSRVRRVLICGVEYGHD